MIGKVINKLLKDSIPLKALVSTKIYPYAIKESDELPAVIYKVVETIPEYDKDGIVKEVNEVDIISVSLSYASLLDITLAARTALELIKGEIEGITVKSCRVQSIKEDFDFETDVFTSKINLLIITQ